MPVTTFAVTAAAALVAAFALGLTGYGFGLIAMGVLPYVMPVAEANAVVVPLALIVTVAGVFPLRRGLRLSVLWPLLVGAAVGVPLGVIYLVRLDERVLRISLGAIILLALGGSILASVRERRAESSPDRAQSDYRSPKGRLLAGAVGMVSGSFGGAFSVSGPPVVFYFSEVFSDKSTIKAHLLAYFTFVIAIRVPLLAASGVYSVGLLKLIALSLPVVGAGLWAGTALHNRLPTAVVRRIIQVLLAISAVLMIVRA